MQGYSTNYNKTVVTASDSKVNIQLIHDSHNTVENRFDNIVASKEREIAELRGQQNTSGSNNRLGLKGITDISSVREGPESSGDLNYAKGKGQSQLLTTEVSTMTEHNSSSDSNCYAQTITPVSMKCTTSEQKRRRCSQEQVGMRAKMTTTVENSNVQVAQDIVKTIKTLIFDSGMCPVCGEAPCGMMVHSLVQ